MKILLISDLHFKSKDKYGLFSIKQKVLRSILKEWNSKVDLICMLGDGADTKQYDILSVSAEAEIWSELGKDVSKVIYLAANHDTLEFKYCHMTPFAWGNYALGEGMTIVGKHTFVKEFETCMLRFRGWYNDEPFPVATDRISSYLFSHARVKEFVHKSATKAYTLEYLESLNYKRIFLGDCHTPIEQGKVVSVGTLCPSDFRDEGLQSTYIVFDTEKNEFERYFNEDYPKFIILDIKEDTRPEWYFEYLVPYNIVRLRFTGSINWNTEETWKKFEKLALEFNPFYLEREIVNQESNIAETVFETDDTDKLIEQEAEESNWLPEYKKRVFELKENLK